MHSHLEDSQPRGPCCHSPLAFITLASHSGFRPLAIPKLRICLFSLTFHTSPLSSGFCFFVCFWFCFVFHVECRWVLEEPLPHHYSVILLHHTEMYSETDVSISFFLQRWSSCTNDTVPCTEYISTLWCLYWGNTGKEIYLLRMKAVSVVFINTGSFLLRMECIFFFLFSALSPSVVCGHSDHSYVADVSKCIE